MKRLGWLLSVWFVLASPALAASGTLVVTLNGFVGLPADSSARGEFMEAFHAAMDADLPCEKRQGDTWTTSGPRRNEFRLVDVAPPDAAWTLMLNIGVPPAVRVARARPKHSKITPRPRVSEVRTSRGLTIVAATLSPRDASNGSQPVSVRFAVYFADARRVVVPTAKLPGGGYEYPWADAGTVVARAALEALHRANGALADDERADLGPATRAEETR